METEKMTENTYTIVENPHEEKAAIMLNVDPWKGLVYQYGKVDFVEGEPQINFERTIRKLPDHETEQDITKYEEDQELCNLMGDILVELLETQIKRDMEKENE